jgi:O-antigen/teichoic acid export membrane protein
MRPLGFHLGWARKLFGYGAWVSVSSLISPVLDTFDQMLIGRMLGAVAIAHYAVPMNLSMRSQVLATALARTLFPRMSREDAASARILTAQATVSLIYGFGAVCGPAIILAGPFLDHWVGRQFAAESRPVAEILMLGAWFNGVAYMPYNQLQALGRPDLTAKVHAVEVVPFVLGLWVLIRMLGLPGAALAWTLRVSGDCIALLWLARCLERRMLRAVPAVALMAFSVMLTQTMQLGLAAALCWGSVVGLAFLACGVLLEPVLRNAAQAGLSAIAARWPRRLAVPGAR